MYLFESWKESLKSLNISFLWESVKMGARALKIWAKYFIWLFFIYIVLDLYYFSRFLEGNPSFYGDFVDVASLFVAMVISCTMIVTFRSFRRKKTFGYFWSYWIYYIFMLLGFVLLIVLSLPFLSLHFDFIDEYLRIETDISYFWSIIYWNIGFSAMLIFPTSYFFNFFILDSKLTFKSFFYSLYNALKMTIYNYPFFFVIRLVPPFVSGLLELFIKFIAIKIFGYSGVYFYNLPISYIQILLQIFSVALFYNFYKRRILEQKKLYGIFKERIYVFI